jgi:hypothetical protein
MIPTAIGAMSTAREQQRSPPTEFSCPFGRA